MCCTLHSDWSPDAACLTVLRSAPSPAPALRVCSCRTDCQGEENSRPSPLDVDTYHSVCMSCPARRHFVCPILTCAITAQQNQLTSDVQSAHQIFFVVAFIHSIRLNLPSPVIVKALRASCEPSDCDRRAEESGGADGCRAGMWTAEVACSLQHQTAAAAARRRRHPKPWRDMARLPRPGHVTEVSARNRVILPDPYSPGKPVCLAWCRGYSGARFPLKANLLTFHF